MASDHERNVGPMMNSRRCGAKTRSGKRCKAPAIAGKLRCRMHGGHGSGAKTGNQNALVHGDYTPEGKAAMREVRALKLLVK